MCVYVCVCVCVWCLHVCVYQLAVVPECSIFIGLADNEIFFADLEVFMIIGHLPRSRGASSFAVDWQKLRGQVGFNRDLRICLAIKKKLLLYRWEKNRFNIKVSSIGKKKCTRNLFFFWKQT